MKNTFLLLALFFVVSSSSFAGNNHSPAQELKKNLVSGCMSRGLDRGDNPAAVYAFCSCTWDVLSKNLTVAEYVQMDALSSTNKSPKTLSFWNQIQSKLQSCKEKENSAVKP